MKKIFILEERFSAAHLYHQPKWSAEKNREVFGRCFTEHGHGHNYFVRAFFTGDPTLTTAQELKKITSVLDHEHLNFVVPEFFERVPTTEAICQYLVDKIQNSELIKTALVKLELFEDVDIGATWEDPNFWDSQLSSTSLIVKAL